MDEVAPEIAVHVDRSDVVCHVYVIVTPVSPSSSVTTAVRVLSSALVPVIDADPISLTLVTVTVND